MTSYDKRTDEWTVLVSYNCASYVKIKGLNVDDKVDAELKAVQHVENDLPDAIHDIYLIEDYPMGLDVSVHDTTIENVEVL
jgi:hypothetical protein